MWKILGWSLLWMAALISGTEIHIDYMESTDACGNQIVLDDDNIFRVIEKHSDLNASLTGHFPCQLSYFSQSSVVCVAHHVLEFYNCTLQLQYLMFKSKIPKDLTGYDAEKTFNCTSDLKSEWCTPGPGNVVILLDKTEASASIHDISFLLEVSRITSSHRTAIYPMECNSTYYLKQSTIHALLLESDTDTKECMKTFTYYDMADVVHSKLCLSFSLWSKTTHCSSYELFIYIGFDDSGKPERHYKCSDPMPTDICSTGNTRAVTLKLLRAGSLDKGQDDFQITVRDKSKKDSSSTDNGEGGGGGLSTGLIVFLSLTGVFLFVFVLIICIRGKRGGGNGLSRAISLPSFDSD